MTDYINILSEGNDRNALPAEQVYEITFKGYLGARWANRFAGFELILQDDGTTRMIGPVIDQSALYGLINQVRDLGLELISVYRACREDLA